jgi:hypothetical protein
VMDDRTALYDASGKSDGIPHFRPLALGVSTPLNFTCLKPVSLRKLLSQVDQGRLKSAHSCVRASSADAVVRDTVGTMCNILRSAHLET